MLSKKLTKKQLQEKHDAKVFLNSLLPHERKYTVIYEKSVQGSNPFQLVYFKKSMCYLIFQHKWRKIESEPFNYQCKRCGKFRE